MNGHGDQATVVAKAIERSHSLLGAFGEKIQTNLRPDYFIGILLLFGAYFVTAKVGLKFDAVSGFATLVWPPSGIALATLIVFGYRWWPGIFLAAFLVNYTTGATGFAAFGIATGNTLEALIGAYLLRKMGFDGGLERVRSAILFLVIGGMLATLVSATFGVTSLWLSQAVAEDALQRTWLSWWVGDMLGVFVIGSLLLNLRYGAPLEKDIARLAEGIVLATLFLVLNFTIFSNLFQLDSETRENLGRAYLIIPLLTWAAIRFGTLGTSLAVLITAAIAAWGTILGYGPFANGSISNSLLLLQMFIGTSVATVTVLAAAVSERERVSQELWGEKVRLEAVLKSIGDGVVVVDRKGRILLINRETEKLLGVRAAEVIGLPYETVVLAQDEKGAPLPQEKDVLRRVLSAESPSALSSTDHYYLPHGGLKFPAALTVAPIFLKNRFIGAVKVFRDISPEKEVDRAKTEAISLASHQLWSPLASLRWYCDALLTDEAGPLNPRQRKYVTEMRDTGGRMMKLVTALLNVSRIELGVFSIRPKPVDIRRLLDDIKRDLIHEIQTKEVKIKIAFVPDDLWMKADVRLLRIVFQNLLSNAVKYSRRSGTVQVNVERKEDGQWFFTVADTGYGIPEDEQGKIFTKLFRATNAGNLDPNGNGLGLYIAQSIVQASGGRIWFVSKPNEGTTFFVNFPKGGMQTRIGDYELYSSSSGATGA